jgi:ATP-dependent Clp protease, protease subunit
MKNLRNLLRLNAKRGEFKAEANTIWLYDMIVGDEMEAEWCGGVAPKPFIDALGAMTGTVHLRINSPGGDVFAATAMAQAMREYSGEIIAHVDGVAASAASVLAVVADKTIMAPGSLLMIHNAWTMTYGDSNDLKETAALLEKVDGMLAQTYADKAGTPAAGFATMMAAETWFTPEEAVAAKLADEVVQAKANAQALGRWDLTAFAAVPASAPAAAAQVTAFPAARTVESKADLERVLRDAGLPKAAARKVVAGGWPALQKAEEIDPAKMNSLIAEVRGEIFELKARRK